MAADRFVLAHIRELIRFGVTRREFAVTLRDEGVPFDEVYLAQMFSYGRQARVRFR